jgi:hypothetical protein
VSEGYRMADWDTATVAPTKTGMALRVDVDPEPSSLWAEVFNATARHEQGAEGSPWGEVVLSGATITVEFEIDASTRHVRQHVDWLVGQTNVAAEQQRQRQLQERERQAQEAERLRAQADELARRFRRGQ